MKTWTIFRRVVIGGCVVAVTQIIFFHEALTMQNEDGAKSDVATSRLIAANINVATPANEAKPAKRESLLAKPADRLPAVSLKKMETDKITSFFVRANDSKRIQLSMLVVYKAELAAAVQKIYGRKVTPLVFSVSTFPNRNVVFDPEKLRFEQSGRIWQPENNERAIEVLPLDDNAKFGGLVNDGEVHQGIVLLPAWMNPKEPITVRYGDFHYLATFAGAQTMNAK
ncbi:MAG: hypothetical protein ONB46_26095 [candidate division KSB1 bacterium]|nr:hypothetical protein [candidate division KSB1 bacterium]MDZ7366871.1 hypothetical protein [candidate division KSB1 bacterium]MDZ7407489.1 hypothetical protein [candidate division KSB1 bacterium]